VCFNGCGVVSVNVITTALKCVRSVLLCLVKNRKLLTCTLKQDMVSMNIKFVYLRFESNKN